MLGSGIMLLINNAIAAYLFIIVTRMLLGLLISLNILSSTNKSVVAVHDLAAVLVDPLTTRLKMLIPFLVVGSLDISPFLLYVLIQVVQLVLLGSMI